MEHFTTDLHERQLEVYRSDARFRVLVAGRRSGKTHLALVEMLMAAQKPGQLIWYIAPTEKLAKTIAWERLKRLTEPYWSKKPGETDKEIHLIWGSKIVLKSAFKPDGVRGIGLDFVVIDEAADVHPDLWNYALRPTLADRKGRALIIGTPKGCNAFYDLHEHAQRTPGWAVFRFTTAQSGLVDAEELAGAEKDMDTEIFRQEMEAEFTNVTKFRVYRAFEKAQNVQPVSFDPALPLVWALDFNVSPMCMLLMQHKDEMAYVLEEIVIKPEAYTELACERFQARAKVYYDQIPYWLKPMKLQIYGDASGHQRRTAGTQTDWAIIKDFLALHHGGEFVPEYYASKANPEVRDRVNSVNARLRNHRGDVRLLIDPKCKELIRDLEEVSWAVDKQGAALGEINKTHKDRTHLSDALGYCVAQVYSLKGKVGHRGDGPVVGF